MAKTKERRSRDRVPVRVEAQIRAPGTAPFTCTIEDVSHTGAKVRIADSAALPNKFVLQIPGNLPVTRLCLVAWRSAGRAGVRFIPKPSHEITEPAKSVARAASTYWEVD